MNEEIMTNETVATEVENPVEETQSTELATSETKSLAKDLGEMAVVGLIIYVFCKAVDWIVDKVKAGIRKFKAEKAAKKAAAQAPAQGAPVATPQAEVKTEETQQ